jgi:hypothetical protein
MYLSSVPGEEPRQVAAPTSTAGLYIHPRSAEGRAPAVKAAIPAECLGMCAPPHSSMGGLTRTAFQIGEALELLTNGRLAATPHFVSGSPASSDAALGEVSRETFAFFLQCVFPLSFP